MDTLSKILDSLHFHGSFYFTTNFNGPWSIKVPHYKNVARFHYVTQGRCWVQVAGVDEAQLLSSGDLIIIPHGATHILSDEADRAPISLDEAFVQENYDGHGVFQIGSTISRHDTQLVCGHFEFRESFRHPLIDHLPEFIITNENDGMDFSWLKDILRFMAHTASIQHDGSAAIIKRLSEVIFIQAVRIWNQNSDGQKGFLAALNDQQLSKGLKAFHENFSANWTVEKLAEQSNMSRSLFSERFKYYLNLSPMQYVTEWRMETAKSILKDSNQSIESIATIVGYESVAAFSKAFKRACEQNPGEYRRLNQVSD